MFSCSLKSKYRLPFFEYCFPDAMWTSFRRRAAIFLSGGSTSNKVVSGSADKVHVPQAPPRQPQPTLEVEEALRRSSLRGTNAARAAASDALERASSSLKSKVGETRAGVERSIGRGKDAVQQSVKETTGSVTNYADALRRSANETVEKSARDLSGRISSTAIAASEEAYCKSIQAKEIIASRAASAVDAAPKVASAASSVASQNVKQATATLISEARETRDKALKWLWWWGLAAVGVYGFATTVPRELIRYAALRIGGDKNEDKTTKAKDEGKQDDLSKFLSVFTSNAEQIEDERRSDKEDASSPAGWKNTVSKLLRSAGDGGWA